MNATHGPFRVEAIDYATGAEDLLAVREVVFIVEQNVPIEEERDALDPQCLHVIARDRHGAPIGTGRLVPPQVRATIAPGQQLPAAAYIGRMAVLREWRGTGVGDALLHALLRQARTLGWQHVALNAQVSAQGFYARHGFTAHGERFIEAGIEHQPMRRVLDRPQAIEDRDAAIAVATELVRSARRSLYIRSRDLDPGLLDAPRVLEALRSFGVRNQGNEVRVLLHDAEAPQRALAPLLSLAQRLPSVFAFREAVDQVDRSYPSAYIANDDGGYYFRGLGHRFDGEADTAGGGRARQLIEHFRPVWERARPCSEYRAIGF
jgi:predicted GNAT family N-acyltransferase